MRTAERRPLVRMYSAPEPAMVPQRYPSTEDDFGMVTAISVTAWLTNKQGWFIGDSTDRQGPVVMAKWFIFLRREYAADFRARGGQLT